LFFREENNGKLPAPWEDAEILTLLGGMALYSKILHDICFAPVARMG